MGVGPKGEDAQREKRMGGGGGRGGGGGGGERPRTGGQRERGRTVESKGRCPKKGGKIVFGYSET